MSCVIQQLKQWGFYRLDEGGQEYRNNLLSLFPTLPFCLYRFEQNISGELLIEIKIMFIKQLYILTFIKLLLKGMFNNSVQHNESIRKKRIVINIERSVKKPKPSRQEVVSIFNPSKQLPKLLEISQRCFLFYDQFKQQKLENEQYTEQIFTNILNSLNIRFKQLYNLLSIKEAELKNSILEKKSEFLSFQTEHFLSLTQKIQNIKEQKNYIQGQVSSNNFFTLSFNSAGELKQNEITAFTKMLDSFYSEVDKIEKMDFKQNLKTTIDFLTSLVEDETNFLKKQVSQDSNKDNISFSKENIFSPKDYYESFGGQSQWQYFRINTQRAQSEREKNINIYAEQIVIL